jgi:hypothetical protein
VPYKTGNATHDTAVLAAELAYQNAIRVPYGSILSAASAKAADIVRLSAIVLSGQANGISVLNEQTALTSVQTTGAA